MVNEDSTMVITRNLIQKIAREMASNSTNNIMKIVKIVQRIFSPIALNDQSY